MPDAPPRGAVVDESARRRQTAIRPGDWVLAVLLAFTAVGCGFGEATIDYVLVNRSLAVLAFAPGIVVGPCSQGSYSSAELRTAGEEGLALSQNSILDDDLTWVPEGAVVVDWIPPAPIDAASPEVFVISGSKAPFVSFGPLDATTIPDCGGQPIL